MDKKTNLSEEKFAPLFGTWWQVIRPFWENGGLDPIYQQLKFDSTRGKKIAPLSFDTYKCFKETPLNEIKVVLLGFSPFHTLVNNQPVADGLLFGCSNTGKLQPSLDQFYNALEKDLFNGLNLKGNKHADVTYLANQGVLMLNAALTTEINKAGSHLKIWEPFIKYVFENIIAPSGVPVVFLGKEPSKFKRYMAPLTWSFEISHPASAAYKNTDWDSEGVFTKVNRILIDNKKSPINWLDNDAPF
jgi:uracil-DNA glycosylase